MPDEIEAPGTDILEYAGAQRHLSPDQFTGGDSAGAQNQPDEPDGLDGPLGSYGEPGPGYWQNGGVTADVGSGI